MIKLKKLGIEEDLEVMELLNDVGGGENGFQMVKIDNENYKEFLELRNKESLGIDLKPNRVAQTVNIFYVEGRPTGIIKVRKELTKYLLKLGGNIGYYIRKDSRGMGYGEKMLGMVLEELRREAKLKKVLITCYDTNIGSARVIEKNGGVLEDIIENTKRYWIEL